MPIYTIEYNGKIYDMESDKPPSEQEMMDVISKYSNPEPEQSSGMERQNILGALFNVPGAAIRSAIQGRGYTQGAVHPSDVPSFQDMAIDAVQKSTSPVLNAIVGLPASQVGMVADIATDPPALLAMLLGLVPTGGGGNLGQLVAKTRPAKALARFGAKQRHPIAALKQALKYDDSLKQAVKAKGSLDTVRNTLGNAKKIAIQEVKDVPATLDWKANKSQKIVDAINNPVYEVEFTQEGGVKNTVGNLDKVKEAVGDLISSEKIWAEAPKKELRLVKQFYGRVNNAMKEAARSVGKPIDGVLENYNKFMKNYRLVNKTLVDSAEQAYGNKLKNAFRFGAEPAYQEAWKEVAKQSPEIKSVMGSMKRREILKNLLKLGGGAAVVGGGGKVVLEKISQ